MSTHGDDESACPCKTESANNILIECAECETSYHPSCCGLDGLTQNPVNKLMQKNWKCPGCFKFAENIPSKKNEPEQTPHLSQQTVDSIITIVNSTVEENLKSLAPENLKQDENNDEPFIQVTRRRHHSIQNAIKEQREEVLIEKKQDNLIIYGMPESASEAKKD